MSQRVNRHRLLDPRPFHRLLENLLGSSTAVTLAGFPPFKKPFGWPIFLPVFAQDLQGSFAEKRVAVFVSFSIINGSSDYIRNPFHTSPPIKSGEINQSSVQNTKAPVSRNRDSRGIQLFVVQAPARPAGGCSMS